MDIFDRDGEVKVFNGPKSTDKFLNAKINIEIDRAKAAEEYLDNRINHIDDDFISNLEGIIVIERPSVDTNMYSDNQLFYSESNNVIYIKDNGELKEHYDLNRLSKHIGFVRTDSTSGTLTAEQYAEAFKEFCIWYCNGVIYLKAKDKESVMSMNLTFYSRPTLSPNNTLFPTNYVYKYSYINLTQMTHQYSLVEKTVDLYSVAQADSRFGGSVELSLNTTNYVLTATLKDKNNNVLNTSTIDLPIESTVVSGSYDSTNKQLVLVLVSGQTINIPIADLISGLVSETYLTANYYSKTEIGNWFTPVTIEED